MAPGASGDSKRRKVEEEKKNDAELYQQVYGIGTKLMKNFGPHVGDFEGEVLEFDAETGWYRVQYTDGDEDDLEEEEVEKFIAALKKKKKKAKGKRKKAASSNDDDDEGIADDELSESPPQKRRKKKRKNSTTPPIESEGVSDESPPAARRPKRAARPSSSSDDEDSDGDVHMGGSSSDQGGTGRRARAKKKVAYADPDEDEFTDSHDEDEEEVPKKKSKAATKRKPRGKPKVDSDEEEFEAVESESSEDEEEFDTDSEPEPESDEEAPRKKKGKKPAAKKAKGEAPKKKGGGQKMCDSFKPLNAPLFYKKPLEEISEKHDFLDPCGMEGSDDIVARLVGEQVDKIGGLLQGVKKHKDMGSESNPLTLGTACSGTDAPALAMMLVQEQLKLREADADSLSFEHKMSCEQDAFKAAYLARNFDSKLYPDITKLCDDPPRDVYGKEEPIPDFNMFVAGTSCKNFSMLRSKKRLDIEDKGCSGETFLGAVEFLFKEKPLTAIFENVTKAPWAKMQEYITGRVKLSECSSDKAISENKDKGKDLTFVLDNDKNIVVDRVPAVYGVRAGSVVEGFLRPGESDVNPVSMKGKKTFTLTELMKANKISKENDTLVFETECTYCTQIVKVDTKQFGLPQTRERMYMFVWQPDDGDVNDDLGFYWKTIVEHLKSPVRHSLQSFVLQDDHDTIRVFREALRGPPGRQTARAVMQEPDFWASASSNLPHNKNPRAKLGLDDTARSITNWNAYGKGQYPLHYWLEYMRCNSQRQLDVVDILHASAMRDAEAHDSNFTSFYWNTSQNASKEKHRSACPGIAGCITPGGEFLQPNMGRPLLGCEKLMIQGIPYERLALGNETEVNLGDLAGNAMSLTVVCATMLAAVTCKELRRATLDTKHGKVQRVLSETAGLRGYREKAYSWEAVVASEGVRSSTLAPRAATTSAASLFQKLASLAPAAVLSSIWCTCETSGSNSLSEQFLQCQVCRASCCRNCINSTSGYNLDSHKTMEVSISPDEHCLANFQSELRQLVPPTLVFGSEGIREIAELNDDEPRCSVLSNYVFALHRIKRDRKKWSIVYYARDKNGLGEAVAEFRIVVGELERQDIADGDGQRIDVGMRGFLKSFFPAKTEPLVYGSLVPFAVVTVLQGSSEIEWRGRAADSLFSSFRLVGEGKTDSARVEVGLTDVASKALVETSKTRYYEKDFQKAKGRGEKRRWLYPKEWKHWPEKIHVTATDDDAKDTAELLSGTYKRAACRHTMNQSALWIKEGTTTDASSLYIMIQPNVNRTGPAYAVISTSLDHDDASSILAVLPWKWQPSDALDPEAHDVSGVSLKNWVPISMECMVPVSEIKVDSPRNSSDVLVSVSGLSESHVKMLCSDVTATSAPVKLKTVGGQGAQQIVRVFNSVCVSSILQYASTSGLKYDLTPDAPWTVLPPETSSVPFGCCKVTVPDRPKETWFFDKEREMWDRRSEPGASRSYCKALEDAPQPFEVWVDKGKKQLTVKCFPNVVAHRAAGQLIEGRGDDVDDVTVSFRLSDLTLQSDPVVSPFKVSSCDAEEAVHVPLAESFALYERQQKVVSKMLKIEESKTTFEELEMSEQEMPGSSGYSLIAKATRDRNLCGGVIADAIGSGKTVISIALILKGLESARKSRVLPNKSGASLVVVPPGLIDQWESEIEKFSTGLNVVKIYDFAALKKVTVKTMVEADVVIAPIDILEAKGYLARLVESSKFGSKTSDIPKLPSHTSQKEFSGASGVWIPTTSADPYGGGNNPRNRVRRTESAYYTHVYLSSVHKLRERDFKPSDKGVPLEYFEWERVFVDEVHETLCTTKQEMDLDTEKVYKEKNRRAGRELLGLTQRDPQDRPLVCRKAVFGLTGTPLLDSSSRVIELGNLMGGTYVIGLSSHWRKLERESARDIFLHNYLEPKQSREMRKNVFAKCQEYLDVACCRNKTGEEMNGIELVHHRRDVKMTEEEGTLYLKSQHGISSDKRSYSIKPADFDVTAGHDITKFLRQNAEMECRGNELVQIVKEILTEDEHTKIIVFADGRIGAGIAARSCLKDSGLGCTYLDEDDTVEEKNKKIAWYQHGDATEEDKARPRVLVLHFEHAAGLNLQTECHNMILFSPLYIGEGGATGDPVSDASTEQQAIGRVFRPGQPNPVVNVFRIEIRGPSDEECLDGQLIRRNTDEETVSMAVNGGE